ncbi:hypothetical protein [Niallia sp. FSL M8-0099]|uniref:hypothetical protein n=1 Tax=Niallia sp. FSL M8-0099 TaxID=2954519 RepID=UPI0030FA1CB9
MDKFLIRLGKSLVSIIGFAVSILLIAITVGIFGGVIFLLPYWLLTFVIGDYATWWIVLVIIGLPIVAEWNKIVEWFKWQFIDPFKKL